jgi:hypothetical protein
MLILQVHKLQLNTFNIPFPALTAQLYTAQLVILTEKPNSLLHSVTTHSTFIFNNYYYLLQNAILLAASPNAFQL